MPILDISKRTALSSACVYALGLYMFDSIQRMYPIARSKPNKNQAWLRIERDLSIRYPIQIFTVICHNIYMQRHVHYYDDITLYYNLSNELIK